MELMYVILALVIIICSSLGIHVTPNKTVRCSNDEVSCLTLQEYANQSHVYFINDTTVHFGPGIHTLNHSLRLKNLHNFTFHGLPDDEFQSVNILLGSLVSITLEECSNIEISSITFTILGHFTFSIIFEHTQQVQLSNISVFGSEYLGNASIMCQNHSTVGVRDSTFIGIYGSLGAALMILGSCVIFTGNNAFCDNIAAYGGSLYILESVVFLSGTNTFLNNTAFEVLEDDDDDEDGSLIYRGSGGAIYCEFSILSIRSKYSVFVSNSAEDSGGAIVAQYGNVTIQGSVLFEDNSAVFDDGGAISLLGAKLILNGNFLFIHNKAFEGGALSIIDSYLHLSEDWWNVKSFCVDATSFCCKDMLTNRGSMGSYSHNSIVSCISYSNCDPFHMYNVGMADIEFHENLAHLYGGAINSELSNIVLDGNTYTYFDKNTARDGGAIYLDSTSKLILSPAVKNISFTNNHAENRGGALYIDGSDYSTLSIECFLSIYSKNSDYAVKNMPLFFFNNSAESTGSILYGGQLNRCRLYYKQSLNERGNKAYNSYSDDALEIFMRMSKIVQYNESTNLNSISSEALRIKFCHGENIIDGKLPLFMYPGEQFNITVVALDQGGSPVPSIIFNENNHESIDKDDDIEYRLSPSHHFINSTSCTNISLQIFSASEGTIGQFQLYPVDSTLCQSLAKKLSVSFSIFFLPCPLGLKLSRSHQCNCDSKLLKFSPKCYAHKSTIEIE